MAWQSRGTGLSVGKVFGFFHTCKQSNICTYTQVLYIHMTEYGQYYISSKLFKRAFEI